MILEQLINPGSIVIVGGSNDLSKPGGRVVNNIITNGFKGNLYVINKRSKNVQGIETFDSEDELPNSIDLAILSIPAASCLGSVTILAEQKAIKAFIILSAGFSETDYKGQEIEKAIVQVINQNGACLIGPNCIGVLNSNYSGVFTLPIPKLSSLGCDVISSSGATAVFLMEAGIPLGVTFSNVFSLGNAAMIGVEEILEYMDLNFDNNRDARIKLLYIEHIKSPKKFLKHAKSLVLKGVKIAAIKAGTTSTGSRAAASHTGALASSDVAIRALFKKAGVIYCSSRSELLSIASIFHYGQAPGKNFAIITHAGGSAVMLSDVLDKGGLNVPVLEGDISDKLLGYLHPGSSVANPIDFLATGTAEQLGIIIDYCENKFEEIDAMIVVFGSPGLFDVENVYNVLSVKLEVCKKPIYPVLPSVVNAQKEINSFLERGNVNFPDEVDLGNAIVAIHQQGIPEPSQITNAKIDISAIKEILNDLEDGFLNAEACKQILHYIGIPTPKEHFIKTKKELEQVLQLVEYPCAIKVLGLIHKTESNGVILNVQNEDELRSGFSSLMNIENAVGVQIQKMLIGHELFIGVKKESPFGHLILCGLGGVFIEILQDYSAVLAPISEKEAKSMIESLRAYPIIAGYRGHEGINQDLLADYIVRISALVTNFPEFSEIDLNPIIGTNDNLIPVDVRIKLDRKS